MHRFRPRLLALIAALAAMALAVVPIGAAGATPNTCHVSNRTMVPHSYYTSLQAAVNDATAGDVLRVRGQCYEHTDVDRDLTIRGQKTDLYGKPILSGYDTVQVLFIPVGVTVKIKRLTIRDGLASGEYPDNSGGGIGNEGTLTLRNVVVRGGHAFNGGGISNRGTMTLNGHTVIMHNHVDWNGGGVDNDSTDRAAAMTMNGTSVIKRNSALRGGGVNLWTSSLTMNDSSSIHHNAASDTGGGVSVSCDYGGLATVGVVDGGNVHDNDPTDVDSYC